MDMEGERVVSFNDAEQLAHVSLTRFGSVDVVLLIRVLRLRPCNDRTVASLVSRRAAGVSDSSFPVQEKKVMFYEVSAYTGANVTESLTHLAR